jgi:hypothetical protein
MTKMRNFDFENGSTETWTIGHIRTKIVKYTHRIRFLAATPTDEAGKFCLFFILLILGRVGHFSGS